MRKARRQGVTKKAERTLRKGEQQLGERQEWLRIADMYGHDVASAFEEGDQVLEGASGKKRKRLMAAVEAKKLRAAQQPFRGRSMGQGPRHWSTSISAQQQQISSALEPTPPAGTGLSARMPQQGLGPKPPGQRGGHCFRCGQPGHYVRFCPRPAGEGQ